MECAAACQADSATCQAFFYEAGATCTLGQAPLETRQGYGPGGTPGSPPLPYMPNTKLSTGSKTLYGRA